ncbi:unnamed protein product [Diatraea saccharalis]|uniref:SAM domain-containing protein n=1 Tax=Diatraea saccharalis TaxID=40085 RepID=A0A9N9QUN8_9NEOP|nr:unnamed protein product [Diatraea saccharalis]
MASENNVIEKITAINKINPTEFDVTVSALLLGVGAEKYLDIFKKHNIGQCTLTELTNEDLIKLGIDDADIRNRLLEEVKNLPLYSKTSSELSKINNNLSLIEIVETLEESSQHLYRIYLSVLANTLAIKKTKNITDCLVYKDKYASDLAISTLSEITNILNSMDIALHTQLKTITTDSRKNRNKKIIIGTIGSVVIVGLTLLFVRSLKDLK